MSALRTISAISFRHQRKMCPLTETSTSGIVRAALRLVTSVLYSSVACSHGRESRQLRSGRIWCDANGRNAITLLLNHTIVIAKYRVLFPCEKSFRRLHSVKLPKCQWRGVGT